MHCEGSFNMIISFDGRACLNLSEYYNMLPNWIWNNDTQIFIWCLINNYCYKRKIIKRCTNVKGSQRSILIKRCWKGVHLKQDRTRAYPYNNILAGPWWDANFDLILYVMLGSVFTIGHEKNLNKIYLWIRNLISCLVQIQVLHSIWHLKTS